MEPFLCLYHPENGKITPLRWSPVWCLPQRLRCQSQYKEFLGNNRVLEWLAVFLGMSMYLMLVLGGLYIYIPVAPSRCGCYGGFNPSFGNTLWSIM